LSWLFQINPNVKGLERAKKFHLMSKVIEHQDFNSREEFDQALLEQILANRTRLSCACWIYANSIK